MDDPAVSTDTPRAVSPRVHAAPGKPEGMKR